MGIINRDRRAENYQRLQTARNRFAQTVDASIDRRERRRAAEAKARAEQALEAQRIAAQAKRDKQQHLYGQEDNVQRAWLNSGAAAEDNRYTTERDKRIQKGTLKRDELQNRATSLRDQQQALDQARRDARLFGYSTLESEQQFGQQMYRDAAQHGYTTERDKLQHGNTLQRDYMQSGIQAERDQRLNEFEIQGDERQQGNIMQREMLQNQFQTERDRRLQGFDQQNMYQREAADISARWQEQVAQAKSAGLDFSAKQRQEMQEMDATFRKSVLNNPEIDEGLKQRALVEHQRKLSAIIPQERVQDPKQNLDQSVMFHEPTKSWFMMRQDGKGPPQFEPLGGGQDPMMKAQQQAEEKKALALQKAEDDREDKFEELVNQMETKQDPLTDEPVYKTREEAVQAAMEVFKPREEIYQRRGLPPLWAYQQKAEEERSKVQKLQMVTRQPVEPVNPYMAPPASGMGDSARLRNGDPAQTPVPAQTPAPSQLPTETTKIIDDQIQKTAAKGDDESNAALEIVKRVTANGAPKPGTPEFKYLIDAYRILQKNGVPLDNMKKTPSKRPRSFNERTLDQNIRRPMY